MRGPATRPPGQLGEPLSQHPFVERFGRGGKVLPMAGLQVVVGLTDVPRQGGKCQQLPARYQGLAAPSAVADEAAAAHAPYSSTAFKLKVGLDPARDISCAKRCARLWGLMWCSTRMLTMAIG